MTENFIRETLLILWQLSSLQIDQCLFLLSVKLSICNVLSEGWFLVCGREKKDQWRPIKAHCRSHARFTDMFLFQLLERQQKKTGNERKLLPFKRWKTCLGIYRSSPRATFSLPVQQTNRWKERPVGQEVWLPRKRTAGVCGLNLLSLYRRIRKHLNKN